MEMTECILSQNEGHVSSKLLLIVSALDRMAAEIKKIGQEDAAKGHKPRKNEKFVPWAKKCILDDLQVVEDISDIMFSYYMEGYQEKQEVNQDEKP